MSTSATAMAIRENNLTAGLSDRVCINSFIILNFLKLLMSHYTPGTIKNQGKSPILLVLMTDMHPRPEIHANACG